MRHLRTSICCFVSLFTALFLSSCAISGNSGIQISPSSAAVRAGATQQFSATITAPPPVPVQGPTLTTTANVLQVSKPAAHGSSASGDNPSNTGSNTAAAALAWSVNGIPGGNSTLGTIDGTGLYTAPSALPASVSLQITAASSGDSKLSGKAVVALENPVPVLASISPTSISEGAFTITATGSRFVKNAQITFGGNALPTTFVSSTTLTASGMATAAQLGPVQISVVNPAPGSASSTKSFAVQVQTAATIQVAITPSQATLQPAATQQFSASVSGTTNPAVIWAVNGVAGGNLSLGVVSASGLYTAPSTAPAGAVRVTATSVADSTRSASATLTLENSVPLLSSVTPSPITVGNFSLTVAGSNFVNGATVVFGGNFIDTKFVSPTQLMATGTAISQEIGTVPVTVQNPGPGSPVSAALNVQVTAATSALTAAAAARFLEQSTWGPTPQSITHVQQIGFQAFLNEQFSAPISTYPAPGATDDLSFVQRHFFANAVTGPDQLRQRVSSALSEMFVISGIAISDPNAFVLWMNMLQNDALGNHANLIKDVTLSPAMGTYLNMANNDGCTNCRPNENYGREVLQLFTIGLAELNPDGTPQLDSSGIPVPTYTQTTVTGFADALTGWTYPAQPGQTAQFYDPQNYSGPMIPFDAHHSNLAKTLLNGTVLTAGNNAQTDLDAALQNIFNHPNVGPFLAKQLIQKLVTSNPSADYVSRVAAVFNDNGTGVRGDLKAVITAILMDSEARRGDDPAQVQGSDGHLKEPLLHILNLLRAANATTDGGSNLQYYASNMGQYPFFPPSVFNFYPPSYVVPGTSLLGPEFKLLNSSTTIARINFVNDLIYGSVGSTTKVDLSQYVAAAPDVNNLLDSISTVMLHSQMPSDMRATLASALTGITDNTQRAKAAFYLIGGSSQYQVQH